MKRCVFVLPLVALILTSCVENNDQIFEDGVLILHTESQRQYLKDVAENIHLYADGTKELSRPLNSIFKWNGGKHKYQVLLSESKEYSNPKVYEVETNEVTFTNLKIHTNYFYKVLDGNKVVKEETFVTSNEIIRNLYVSGVTNVRDLGGYTTASGVLNQGLIYRTGRLNQNKKDEVTLKITEKGIDTMLNDLKVKSEIDLRLVDNNEVGSLTEGIGVLGESVKYYQCPMDYFSTMSGEINDNSLRRVFEILGDKNNYPTFFHCSIGTDRTGYVAWLINSYLGVEEEYLWRDYLFSNFGDIGSSRAKKNIEFGYVQNIKDCEGDTLKEKTKNYLLERDIEQSWLDVLEEMMLSQ